MFSTNQKEKKSDTTPALERHRLQHFMQESSNIFGENRLMRYVLVAMVVWSAFNTILLQNALEDRIVVIMPPDESYALEVSATQAQDSYLYRMARYVTFLSANLTAATGRDQLNELLRIIHPTRYNEYQGHFNTLAKEIERYPNISYLVEINGEKAISVEGNKITIDATKKRIVGDTVTRKDRLTYEIEFVIEAGRFWLKDIKEISLDTGTTKHEA